MWLWRTIAVVVLIVLAGCGVRPGVNLDPVAVDGAVTVSGKAVSGVTLQLQPTGKGVPASLPVKDGKVSGSVTPGKYTYYLQGDETLPKKCCAGSLERQIEIKDGGNVAFAFE